MRTALVPLRKNFCHVAFFQVYQQDAALYNIIYYCQCSTCFRRFLRHHRELKTVHTASGICQACLVLPLAWVSWNSVPLAVAASKLDLYQMLCVQF